MRKLLPFLSLFFTQLAVAQYGNEWIDFSPNRYYLKAYVVTNGVYHIDYNALNTALQQSNIPTPLSSIDPRSIQIFGRGEEVYIHIEGESDGSFDSGDYIEFYAQRNDGWLYERLYPSKKDHTNPFYSLVNDTAAYFITWYPDGSFSNKRMITVPFTTAASTVMPYFIYERTVVYSDFSFCALHPANH